MPLYKVKAELEDGTALEIEVKANAKPHAGSTVRLTHKSGQVMFGRVLYSKRVRGIFKPKKQ